MPETEQQVDYSKAVFEDGGNIVVDMTSVAEAKFELIPKAIYTGEIDSCEYKMSSNNAPMWECWVRIDAGDYTGRKLPYYFSFSAKALPFTKAAMAKVCPELLGSQFNPQKIADEGVMLGKKLRFRVGHKDYEGQTRHNISQILSLDGGAGSNGGTQQGSGSFL